jgi:hypothetical protein
MEVKQKKELAFNDTVMAAYELWQAGQTERMLQLAIKSHLVVFREQPQILISSPKGISA